MATTFDGKTIASGDPVRHRDGKTYSVTEATPDGVTISEAYLGEVFTGTVEQARMRGFGFGDEPFYSNARPIGHFDLARIAEIGESAIINLTAPVVTPLDTLQQQSLASFAASAPPEIERLHAANTNLSSEVASAEARLRLFKAEVRTAIIEAARENDLCREGTNEVLSSLDLEEWVAKWTVTGTLWGKTLIVVTDVEADSDDEAITHVANDLRLDIYEVSVTLTAEADDTDGASASGEGTFADDEVGTAFSPSLFMDAAAAAIEWEAKTQD
jgi:hypothetical protein